VRELVQDGSVSLPDGETVEVASSDDVESGAYLIFAKTTIEAETANGTGHSGSVVCSLNEDPSSSDSSDDTAETRYERGNETATLALQVTAADASDGTARLRCRRTSSSGSRAVVARDTKIILVPIGSTNVEVAGAGG
jgi:hypothetical protein